MVKSDHEVAKVIVSRPVAPLHADEVEFEAFVAAQPPLAKPAATGADDPGFWLYSSGSTGRPKGTVHSQANPYWTAELYGKGVLGLRESDVCFSAAKLFFAYGLGNALSFPMSVGATTLLMAERPTPDATFKRWTGGVGGVKPTVFYGAPTGFAGMLASPESAGAGTQVALRLVSSAGEALPAEIGERFKRHFGVRHRRRHRLHRDAAHLPVQPARARCATAAPAGRCRATTSSCAATTAGRCPTASPATCTSAARRRR